MFDRVNSMVNRKPFCNFDKVFFGRNFNCCFIVLEGLVIWIKASCGRDMKIVGCLIFSFTCERH
ncbi:unnamed protein product [Moneuplotes crassus]|uniref:Uncharacterized protein n=1 Tax=Euplotes crassus TaxID=5936 RepID=A0AAD1XKB0_EUPCR|nr:unnamed protein product [Moneuplotes crassus]